MPKPKQKISDLALAKLDIQLTEQMHELMEHTGPGIYKVIGATLEKITSLSKAGKSVHIDVSTFDEKEYVAKKSGKDTWIARKKTAK